MSVTRNQVTAKQWCCLWDAVQGNAVVPAGNESSLWSTSVDGAIRHPARVVKALAREGLLRKVATGVYLATQMSALALLLPVEGNACLQRLASAVAASLVDVLG